MKLCTCGTSVFCFLAQWFSWATYKCALLSLSFFLSQCGDWFHLVMFYRSISMKYLMKSLRSWYVLFILIDCFMYDSLLSCTDSAYGSSSIAELSSWFAFYLFSCLGWWGNYALCCWGADNRASFDIAICQRSGWLTPLLYFQCILQGQVRLNIWLMNECFCWVYTTQLAVLYTKQQNFHCSSLRDLLLLLIKRIFNWLKFS